MYFPELCTDARETAEYCCDLPTELPLTQSWSAIPSIPVVVAPTWGMHPLCQRTKALRASLWQAGNVGWNITEE